ncbi:uncharacterized protein FOMMEDRAFT_165721 [Fomitiporia mediterranea MF3/22]|uniref:uncharacterized protein n=1 Tax=Fomitiporia mediterranea (strain MF3/22) TaxID=694068 RepID=UPI0004408695|nr:uncharacterized protein FOMMEDRAFT_165721 [Fomitiporia mediterranea MF3/22]EJD07114.1 hypothetical protein FOMMEDRAFT_165721 [Fomitiporia mediterranea MF3/22]
MAANTPLIERVDIHKSCKALESIVNIFNDYCQAAEALASVQKKFARALKDVVGQKATNELAGNALSAAAMLLESLAEVDAKFVKTIDKECEGTSNDLKKWFKTLGKEERKHDEKINAANTKIKQAGQQYEKKAKKKDRDAAEEHTRYVNLLSVIGPEMSQEKYNHSLFVTQRHTAMLYNVTSSVSRAADAEWTRACDCVRKFAPVIGRIGECRAYLEGGWMLNIPDSGGSDDDKSGPSEGTAREQEGNGKVDEMGVRIDKSPSGSTEADQSVLHSTAPALTPALSYASSTSPSSPFSYSTPTTHSPPSAPRSLPSRSPHNMSPPTSFVPALMGKLNTDSVRSIESLSSFPTPPTHFPLPMMAQLPSSPLAQASTEQIRAPDGGNPSTAAGPNDIKPISDVPRMSTTPVEQTAPPLTADSGHSTTTGQSQPPTPLVFPNVDGTEVDKDDTVKLKAAERPQSPHHRRRDSVPPGTNEMGMQERKVSGNIERTESVTSTNSIVASMRDKWVRGDVPSTAATAPQRDIPRVPNKVADLASRYAPSSDTNARPLSPRNTGQVSPTTDRPRQASGPTALRDNNSSTGTVIVNQVPTSADAGATPSEIDLARRRRRIEELEELERREQAQALRAREREIEMQTKELERERERLRALGIATSSSSGSGGVRTHQQHSYSMVNLVPSRSGGGGGEVPVRPTSQYGEPIALSASQSTSSSSNSNPSTRPDHAPYCGCQTCSASQYSNPPSHVQAAPQPRMQREKPKGWMRRLSMPVVSNAFSSSDSKKPYGIGPGVAGGGKTGGPAPYFEADSTGGISNVNPGRQRKLSFGRR